MVVNKRRPNPAVLAAIENSLFREAYKGALMNGAIAFVVGNHSDVCMGWNTSEFPQTRTGLYYWIHRLGSTL